MKLEVGIYVRTKNKGILPLFSEDKEHYYFGKDRNDIKLCCLKKDIGMFLSLNKMPSHNIIDLIEVGDILLVNDVKYTVCQNEEHCNNILHIKTIDSHYSTIKFLFEQDMIEAILTHEQFEREAYKV